MINRTLAIAIPTFNRADLLEVNICSMLPELREFSIPIYVSDDSSNDDTKLMIAKLQKSYQYIFYSKNDKNLGHDKNVFQTLKFPGADYVWLLGDSLSLKSGAVPSLLKAIVKNQPEIIGVNANNRDLDFRSSFYDDGKEILSKFAWHLTLTGATVYSRNAIHTISVLKPTGSKNFPQIDLIFKHLSMYCSFYWVNDKWVCSNGIKESYWLRNIFQVFLDDWGAAIWNLPECYDDELKEKVIIDHSLRTNLFTFKMLLLLRASGSYDLYKLGRYKKALLKHSELKYSMLILAAVAPKTIVKWFQIAKRIFERS